MALRGAMRASYAAQVRAIEAAYLSGMIARDGMKPPRLETLIPPDPFAAPKGPMRSGEVKGILRQLRAGMEAAKNDRRSGKTARPPRP